MRFSICIFCKLCEEHGFSDVLAKDNVVTLAYPNAILNPSTINELDLPIVSTISGTEEFVFNQDTPELSPNNLDSTTIYTYDVVNKVKAKFFTSDKHHEIAETVEFKKMTPQATLPTR